MPVLFRKSNKHLKKKKVYKISKKKVYKTTFHQKKSRNRSTKQVFTKNILQENGLQNKPSPKKDPRAGIFFVFG